MKTLDKKISVSSDQLDTLTTEQRADKFAQVADDNGDDGDDGDVQLDTLSTEHRVDKFAQIPYQMIHQLSSMRYKISNNQC